MTAKNRGDSNVGKVVTAPSTLDVFGALGEHRPGVVARARAAGCDLDRWKLEDWRVMSREMTRLEDELEAVRRDRPTADRARVRPVRRALELAEQAREP